MKENKGKKRVKFLMKNDLKKICNTGYLGKEVCRKTTQQNSKGDLTCKSFGPLLIYQIIRERAPEIKLPCCGIVNFHTC